MIFEKLGYLKHNIALTSLTNGDTESWFLLQKPYFRILDHLCTQGNEHVVLIKKSVTLHFCRNLSSALIYQIKVEPKHRLRKVMIFRRIATLKFVNNLSCFFFLCLFILQLPTF